MKKTKRIISVIVAFAMMLTMALPVMAANGFSDVPLTHQYYTAITNLTSEGILNGMGDGIFQPEGPVTRAQFTKIVCYALSMGDLQYSEEERSIFKDVVPSHWAANNILTAYKRGIVNGLGDNLFGPENGVRYEDAVIMVMRALGYSDKEADRYRGEQGAYYAGYMSLASSKKLLKGIKDAKIGEVMTRGAIAQLVDNMLDVEQIVDGESQGSIRDEIGTSNKIEGQVVAAYNLSIYDTGYVNNCNKHEIALETSSGEVLFDIYGYDVDIYDILGRSVTIYYEEEVGASDIVTNIALQPGKNKEVKIDFDLIDRYDADSIEYYTSADRARTEEIEYSSGSDNLYNGKATARTIKQILDADWGDKSGYITLICSESNDIADVAFIDTYETYVVDYVDKVNLKVNTKNVTHTASDGYPSSIILDVEDRTKDVKVTLNGKDYEVTSLATNDILLVSKSEDGKKITALVTKASNSTKGTIEAILPNSEGIKLKSNNKTYVLSPDVDKNGGELGVGKYVTFTLDAFGKVARYVITTESSYSYGYLAGLSFSTRNEPMKLYIYKAAASNSTLSDKGYALADRVKIDDGSFDVEEQEAEIATALEADASLNPLHLDLDNDPLTDDYTAGDTQYSQPVRFTVNSEGKINSILTHNSNTGVDFATMLKLEHHTTTPVECSLDGATFKGGKYRISGSTPIIVIPEKRATSGYDYLTKTNNFFKSGKKYFAQFANVNASSGVVGCIYLYGIEGSSGSIATTIDENSVPMIVTAVMPESYHEESDSYLTMFKLLDVTTNEEIFCYDNGITGTEALATVVAGDIIRVAISDEGYVEDVEVLADAANVIASTFSPTLVESDADADADFRSVIATIKSVEGNYFKAVEGYNSSAPGEVSYEKLSTTSIYLVDTAETGVRMVQKLDGLGRDYAGSKALIYTSDAKVKAIIIFQ